MHAPLGVYFPQVDSSTKDILSFANLCLPYYPPPLNLTDDITGVRIAVISATISSNWLVK